MRIYVFEYWEEDPCHWEYLASFVGAPSKRQIEDWLSSAYESITDGQYIDLINGDAITTTDSKSGWSMSYKLDCMRAEKGEA